MKMLYIKREMVRFLRGFNAVTDFMLLQTVLGYTFEENLQDEDIVQPLVAWIVRLKGGDFVALHRRSTQLFPNIPSTSTKQNDTQSSQTSLVVGLSPLKSDADKTNSNPNIEMSRIALQVLTEAFRLEHLTTIEFARLGVITNKDENFRELVFLHECFLTELPQPKEPDTDYQDTKVIALPTSQILTPRDYDSWSAILATFVKERHAT